MVNARPGPTVQTSSDTRCHVFKIPLELRDNIYDYVAHAEKNPGLHVNLETATEPKLHAYGQGLSQTCSQIRQEYTERLQLRIKHMVVDYQTFTEHSSSTPLAGFSMSQMFKSQTVLIAERKASRGVWVQDAVALRTVIPLACLFDPTGQVNTLTFTVASSDIMVYNRQFDMMLGLAAGYNLGNWDLVCALRSMKLLERVAELETRNWWMRLWNYHFTENGAHYFSIAEGLGIGF
jgi:hypothetical protein